MTVDVPSPYLLFLGDITEVPYAKTALGLRDWAPEKCVGEYALPAATVTTGLPRLTPAEAARTRRALAGHRRRQPRRHAESPEWMPALLEALEAGLDIVSGMHARLADNRELDAAATRLGRRLIDVRRPPPGIPIASGRKRSGKRLLTVGTDCALGKKYTALALAREFRARGLDADFRATGQTGILIAGSGIPIDAVVADFVAGAAELLSPDADADHWDVIEGQGSLFHPSYAGVSLGLLHGTQPDVHRAVSRGRPRPAFSASKTIRCRRSTKRSICTWSWRGARIPDVRCAGVSLNTSRLAASRCARCAGRAQGAARPAGRGSDARRAGARGVGRIMSVTEPLARVTLQVSVEKWPLKAPFRITGYTFVEIDVVIATVSVRRSRRPRRSGRRLLPRRKRRVDGGADRSRARATSKRASIAKPCDACCPRAARATPSTARCGISKRVSAACPAWKIAGLNPPVPLVTTFTLGAEDPEQMARTATLVRRRAGDQAQAHRHARSMPTAYGPCGQRARKPGSESTPIRASRAPRSPT